PPRPPSAPAPPPIDLPGLSPVDQKTYPSSQYRIKKMMIVLRHPPPSFHAPSPASPPRNNLLMKPASPGHATPPRLPLSHEPRVIAERKTPAHPRLLTHPPRPQHVARSGFH